MPLPAVLPILILTYFEPFAGRDFNRSETVALALAEEPVLRAGFARTLLCRIPVAYDEAEKSARRCIFDARAAGAQDGPLMVVSLGEHDGSRLRIETAAHNWDGSPGLADNAGVIRSGSKIIEDGPASLGFRFPFTEFFKSPALRSLDPKVSSSPGAFLCNHLAYRLTHELVGDPFVFIHVSRHAPDRGEPAISEAAPLAEALVRAATARAPEDRAPFSLKELQLELRSGKVPPDEAWWKSRLADDLLDRVH